MRSEKDRDALKSVLHQLQCELSRHLGELCAVKVCDVETTGELERLSDDLLVAAHQARTAVSIRKHIREDRLRDDMERVRQLDAGSVIRET
jgi:hypothetical protein